MEDKLKENLEKFLDKDKATSEVESKEILIQTKTGLVERVDKKLVLGDGRELLREQLYEAR